MALLEIQQLEKSFLVKKDKKKHPLMAVNDVSFSIEKGSCVGLVGESGCGKTTLGHMILGLKTPSKGEIYYKGETLKKKRSKEQVGMIQMVFQESYDAINPRYNAKQIIEEPMIHLTNLSAEEREHRVKVLLNQVGIPENEMYKPGMEFSGGQLQRICIARALASDPELVVLDEPLSSLDVSVQAQILNLLHDIKEERGLSYLFISHDLEAIYYLSDRIIVMYGGQVMEQIDDMAYFNDLTHPYTKMLFASVSGSEYDEDVFEENKKTSMEQGAMLVGENGCPFANRCKQAGKLCFQQRPELKTIKEGHLVACHME